MGITFTDINEKDPQLYCLHIRMLELIKELVLFLSSIFPVLLNEVVAYVFLSISVYLGTYLKSQE